jgi:predicted dehydrogenase
LRATTRRQQADNGYRLAEMAERSLVNQVGYHNRFVAPFNEAKRLLDRRLIGDLHHISVEAYTSIVFGASSRSHIAQIRRPIEQSTPAR